MKKPERRQRRSFGVFIDNFEQIYTFSSVYIVNLERVNASWILDMVLMRWIYYLKTLKYENMT